MRLEVNPPPNFYGMVAKRHLTRKKSVTEQEPISTSDLDEKVETMLETEAMYYKDPFQKEFQATVIAVIDDEFVVLDRTCFYPEGGGQPGDLGVLQTADGPIRVVETRKVGRVILHHIEGKPPVLGSIVHGTIDWDRRVSLMRHHTGTHLVLGAARRVLGQHAWQAGAQKGIQSSRIDISHYERLTEHQIHEIERLATDVALQDVPVQSEWLPREKAERIYGYVLYQGGVVPGRELRIIKIDDWDVEACGGTHCTRTGQVGMIKIIHTERVQDGIERIEFTAGTQALRAFQEQETKLRGISNTIEAPFEKVDQYVHALADEKTKLSQRLAEMMREWADKEANRLLKTAKAVGRVKLCQSTYMRGTEDDIILLNNLIVERDPDAVTVLLLVQDSARIFVGAGREAIQNGANAGQIATKLASLLGGGGGGREYFGQGGGKKANIQAVTENTEQVLRMMLTK
jgi:alanyl-tRNA synthetase